MNAFRNLLCLTVVTFSAVNLSAQDQQAQERPIQRADSNETELLAVPLDSDAYELLTPSMQDIRVVDSQQHELAYVVRERTQSSDKSVQHSWMVRNPRLQPSAETGLIIEFDLDRDDPTPTELTIQTPLSDFEQNVQLFALMSGASTPLVNGELIFDYQRYMNVRRTTIQIPPTSARSFRLVVGQLTSEQESLLLDLTRELRTGEPVTQQERVTIERRPFRIDGIQLSHSTAQLESALTTYPLKIAQRTEDAEHKQTILELSSRREPLSEFEVITSSRNFSRSARIEVANDKGDRSSLTSGTLSSIHFRSLSEDHLELKCRPVRHRRYFLVIDNGDSPPLEDLSVEARGKVDEVVVLAEPGQQLSLRYGDGNLEHPAYDTAALQKALSSGEAPMTAQLGPAAPFHPAPVPPQPFQLFDIINNPAIAAPLILLLVGILGWGLYQAVSRVDAASKDNQSANPDAPGE